ncbi:hypothetical protein GF324_10455 [bacterium]|nr:hypothetical protein [bacterium]
MPVVMIYFGTLMATRIGIVRLSSLGDIVLTGPAVRGLRRACPDATLVFLTTIPYRDVANLLPEVDEVIAVERRGDGFYKACREIAAQHWDLAADLQGSRRSRTLTQAMHTSSVLRYTPPRLRRSIFLLTRVQIGRFEPVPLRYLRTLSPWGVKDEGDGLELRQPEAPAASLRTDYPWLRTEPMILVPGSKHATKQWPGSYWAELAARAAAERPVAVVGLPGEMPPALKAEAERHDSVHDLTGRLSIPDLIALLSRAGAVVSGDTGPMHLAVAVGAPLVAIFGPTVEQFGFFPFRAHSVQVLQQDLWCRPCTPHGSARCPLGHHRCMRDTTVEDVMRALQRVMKNADAEDQDAGRE